MSAYRIALLPGDGIGTEVIPEARRVLEAAGARFGLDIAFEEFGFSCCAYYEAHGAMLPPDWRERLGEFDALLFGAVGWPAAVPDHVSLWGSLVEIRRGFDQYVGLRPVRLFPGVRSPLRHPGNIDLVIVRENSEGEYSQLGGRIFGGTEREVVVQETVMTRTGVDRIVRYAFEYARKHGHRRVTSATKSNGIAIAMPYWDERARVIAAEYPDVAFDQFHMDNLTAQLVLDPSRFEVIVGSNLFGDILSDLGPALTGTIGIAASGNINPEGHWPSLFEPVHGSAPDIAGQGVANPIGAVWASAMMLEHLGQPDAAGAVLAAIETVLAEPRHHTPDLDGTATTESCGTALAEAVANAG